MSKYIDADKLIAEIEKRRDNALERQKNLEKIGQETVLNEMIAFELNKILSFITSLQQEQPEEDLDKGYIADTIQNLFPADQFIESEYLGLDREEAILFARHFFKLGRDTYKEPPQMEISLRKFIAKIDGFQARYKYPESISIKGAMAFMARMFYQYPNVARKWYDSLPKATMDNERKEE